MPKVKYKKLIEKLKEVDFFSFKSIESRIGKTYAKILLHNLLKKRKIIRLKKGWYSFKKSPLLLVNLLVKGYIGLGSAALIHEVWDKAVNMTILTPLAGIKIREGERIIGKRKVIVKKISEKMYFGYEFKKLEGINIRVSDPEKTLIDMIYFNYPFLDEIKGELVKICNRKKLESYIKIIKKRKVKGYKKIKNFIQDIMKKGVWLSLNY